MKKYVALLGLFFTAFSWAAGAKPIVFATEATYPPHVFMSASGAINGFDVDIVQALCKEMQASCKIINQPWESLIPGLNHGKFDAIFGGLSITDARAKQVDFTDPYYKDTGSFIARQPLVFSVSGLKGKTIGVQAGSTFDFYLQGLYGKEVTIKRYPSIQNAFLDLKTGRVDTVLGDTPVIQQETNADKKTATPFFLSTPIDNEEYLGKGDGIAVRKGSELRKQLNTALQIIMKNGKYQIIKNKYFPDHS